MHNIFITGSGGFIGKNIMTLLNDKYTFYKYKQGDTISIKNEVVIHLAGIAHDIKNTLNTNEYYLVNTNFTIDVFNSFLISDSKIFIFISSVKAVADTIDHVLTENHTPNPKTDYGKSKLKAEEYILNKKIPTNKRVYILRPCMIHGPGNKGNLNLLYKIVKIGIPWPLGAFDNKRSFCSINNLCFIIQEIIQNDQIASGIYNIADDESISTNELVKLIAKSLNKNAFIFNIPKFLINGTSKLGDIFKLPLNSERLSKLTENYVVSNQKIKAAINKPLPYSSYKGLEITFHSFIN
jgi:nucleoside-diphosphate-sugar epimerase